MGLITDGRPFDTNVYFSGGAGMFVQYHDIIKPVYLYAIAKMIVNKQSYGLPLNIISNISPLSVVEWYVKRRYLNPLKCLDYMHKASDEMLDDLLFKIMNEDETLYTFAPSLNFCKMMQVYKRQHMTFPVYVYSEKYEPHIKTDIDKIFSGIDHKYVYGDLKESIKKCDQNFTYIFSNINLLPEAASILLGSCSHVLLASDYRYNYTDNCQTTKIDLKELRINHPFIRVGTTCAVDYKTLVESFTTLNPKLKEDF